MKYQKQWGLKYESNEKIDTIYSSIAKHYYSYKIKQYINNKKRKTQNTAALHKIPNITYRATTYTN